MQLSVAFCVTLMVSIYSWSAQEVFVRVRTVKDVTSFPTLSSVQQIEKLGATMWLATQNLAKPTKSYIMLKPNKKYDVISVVPFDDYLAGVVSKEMPLSWPLEALKAQAVIARSYALSKIEQRRSKIFHVESDQMDQVFSYTDSPKALLAVKLTENVLLLDQQNRVLRAFYHADCGGQTVPASSVWPGAIDSGTATDPWCSTKSSNAWTTKLSKEDFKAKFGTEALDLKKFKSKITTLGEVSIQKIRESFGFNSLRSPPAHVAISEDQILFQGKGYGHGAGLCQWGTLAQVRQGRSYLDVLAHYYPEAQIAQKKNRLTKVDSQKYLIGDLSSLRL